MNLEFVRAQFPAFAEASLHGQAFFENAGGSYTCGTVSTRLAEYYRRLKVQPYGRYAASKEAGEWMDASHTRLAEYLGVGADEIHFGPSSSQNTYVLAQAFAKQLKPGDEIVVTNQDHEANSGVWRRLATNGITLREWKVDAATGRLNPAELDALLSDRTRLVAFPHCSNIVGHINPVAQITAKARAVGAVTVVDGVSYAPHGFPDVRSLGADIYFFSLYKTFGPHQGLMVVRKDLLKELGNEGHYFNAEYPRKQLTPAGPDHAQIASAQGIAEYFDALDAHHGGGVITQRPQRVRTLLRETELRLLPQLLDFLSTNRNVRLLGPADAPQRAATVAFVPRHIAPGELVDRLDRRGIMAGAGHFYAVRLLEAMGVDAARGVTRLSFVHYTSVAEVTRLIAALDAELGPA